MQLVQCPDLTVRWVDGRPVLSDHGSRDRLAISSDVLAVVSRMAVPVVEEELLDEVAVSQRPSAVDGDPAFAAQPTLNASRIDEVTRVLASGLQKLVLKLDALEAEEVARSSVEQASRQLGSGRIGFFEAVADSEADLSEATTLRRREGESPLSYAAADEGRTRVVIGPRTYAMSAGAVPALAILREKDVVGVDELAGEIGVAPAITLARTLLRIGHLVPVQPPR
ncbi:hypothetical protein [Clavibacter sp. 199]|uniref:hypothetical protein n=1 Tax=Clavibacter nebraskensis TaxID=31963 RepID=UPI000E26D66A